jgi:signal transduction histidine kinase
MKYFCVFVFIFIFLICEEVYAQKTRIDSLKSLLTTSISDTHKINVLNQLAYTMLIDQPAQAKLSAGEALLLAQKLNLGQDIQTSKAHIGLADQILSKQSNFRNVVLLGTVLGLGLIYVLFRNNRQQNISKEGQLLSLQSEINELQTALREKEDLLKQQQEEFDALHNDLETKIQGRTIELQSAAENLLQRNKDLEEFSYIVSHNLRAPVANMLGLASLFRNPEMQGENRKELIPHLEDSAKRLDTTIRDLSEVLSIRNSAMKSRENINLADTVNFIKKSLKNEITENEAEIQTDFSESPHLFTVRAYLETIIYNLLSNAIKYRSPFRKPKINLRTRLENGYVCLLVTDNGLGIDLRAGTYKIFGLYQRMHTHTEGKGLGLYMVQTQVESLNGKIEVESEVGVGTTFKVYFKR